MHIFQLISGVLFTILTGMGLYMAYSERSNVFFAASMLFLIIAISCYILALVRIRKRRKKQKAEADSNAPPVSENEVGADAATEAETEHDPEAVTQEEDNPAAPADDNSPSSEENTDDEPQTPEINPAAPHPDAPEEEFAFFDEFETDLSRMDAEILLTNQRINVTEDDIRQMSKTELEDCILHTQIAINAFNRMKIFCEGKGSVGSGYYAGRMKVHEEDPSFLPLNKVTQQMDLLQKTYENYPETADDEQ